MINFPNIRNLLQSFDAPSEPSSSPSPEPAQQDSQEAYPASPQPRSDNPPAAIRSWLQNLPRDVLGNIVRDMDLPTIAKLRQTCTDLNKSMPEAVTHLTVDNREKLEKAIEVYKGGGITALTVTDRDFTDADLLRVTKKLPGLKRLKLAWCWKLTDARLAHLKHLTELQQLDLSSCWQLTGEGFVHLKHLTELKQLDLSRCWLLTVAGLAHLKSLPALQQLNLAKCRNLTNEALIHLESFPALQQLNLTECPWLTASGMERLRNQLPNCVVTTRAV